MMINGFGLSTCLNCLTVNISTIKKRTCRRTTSSFLFEGTLNFQYIFLIRKCDISLPYICNIAYKNILIKIQVLTIIKA